MYNNIQSQSAVFLTTVDALASVSLAIDVQLHAIQVLTDEQAWELYDETCAELDRLIAIQDYLIDFNA